MSRQPLVLNVAKLRLEDNIKLTLMEPLINCILQQNAVAKPFTCEIFKVYVRPAETGYEFIYKLEDLKGDSIKDTVGKVLGADKEANLKILVKIYGPLLEALQTLRKDYSFEHGDLHGDNIMFVNKPNFAEETNLDVKMIDFGYSSLTIGGKTFGIEKNKYLDA